MVCLIYLLADYEPLKDQWMINAFTSIHMIAINSFTRPLRLHHFDNDKLIVECMRLNLTVLMQHIL